MSAADCTTWTILLSADLKSAIVDQKTCLNTGETRDEEKLSLSALPTVDRCYAPLALFSKDLARCDRVIDILALKVIDQETGGGARGCVGAINGLKAIGAALAVRKIELHQARVEVVAHHRFRHVAPTNTFLEQHVLGPKIGEAPSVVANNGEFLAFCER